MLRSGRFVRRVPQTAFAVFACWVAVSGCPWAASKSVDLDAQPANGNESRCDLNVLSTFPVKVENVVTNKAIGDAFDFKWPSAGPGGFTSSAAAGTSGGVGAKWTWTTNESVYSYTGSTCEKDVCFLQTMGPDPLNSTCSLGCAEDGVTLTAARGATSDVVLSWSGGDPSYTVYRSPSPIGVSAASNQITSTSTQQYTDGGSGAQTSFYLVRGATCFARKSCVSDTDCDPATEGSCFSRGPFSVPGRSLTATDITVSSASLTSSVITFFSPPTEVFRATSIAQPGGSMSTYTNNTGAPVTRTTEDYPPGCCPGDPNVPQQLRCGDECVDYLNDPQNCGACGNVCDADQCCSNGNCVDLCPAGQVLCDGQCVDLLDDSANCGACGNTCPGDACCNAGVCEAFCDPGDTWCDNGLCADLLNDATNCGDCGNDCGSGACCDDGLCESLCDPGRTYCDDGLCHDLLTDPDNCGACGNSCGGQAICDNGQCVPCDGQGGAKYACDNRCVNLNTDPYNCGACGDSCELECPSGFTGVCSQGSSCRCEEGQPVPPPPPNYSLPMDPFCPNPNPSPGPVPGGCANPNPTSPQPAVCPSPGPPAPQVSVAPTCETVGDEQTVLPGETITTCTPGGLLFREVPTVLTVCGDTIPGPDGTCGSTVSNVASGTFMQFVPDTETQVGDAFVTPFAVHVTSDDSNDFLIAPGETATMVVDVLNAGPFDINDAAATLIADPVDLTDDGIPNPVALTVLGGSSPYGTVAGTQPSLDCDPVVLQPAANQVEFQVQVPLDYPADTAYPMRLQFSGTVAGSPWQMDMRFTLGIADLCVYADGTRDFDGIDGLLSPMARLVPEGDPVPFPTKALNAGKTAPLKMRQFCGGVELRGADVDAPEIVGLSEATLGDLDILTLNLNDDSTPDDLFFRWNDSVKQWIFNMRTSDLGLGVYTLKIRVAGRKEYLTGFELR